MLVIIMMFELLQCSIKAFIKDNNIYLALKLI